MLNTIGRKSCSIASCCLFLLGTTSTKLATVAVEDALAALL